MGSGLSWVSCSLYTCFFSLFSFLFFFITKKWVDVEEPCSASRVLACMTADGRVLSPNQSTWTWYCWCTRNLRDEQPLITAPPPYVRWLTVHVKYACTEELTKYLELWQLTVLNSMILDRAFVWHLHVTSSIEVFWLLLKLRLIMSWMVSLI